MSALGKQSTLEALWAESQDIWHSPTSASRTTLDVPEGPVWPQMHHMYYVTRHHRPCACVSLIKCFQTERRWNRSRDALCSFGICSRDTRSHDCVWTAQEDRTFPDTACRAFLQERVCKICSRAEREYFKYFTRYPGSLVKQKKILLKRKTEKSVWTCCS